MESESREKDKRKQKHKKKKRHRSSSSSESSSYEEWVDAKCTSSLKESSNHEECVEARCTSSIKRDDWMSASSFVPTLTKEEIRGSKRKKELKELSTLDKPGQHQRELNPYWKDGGIGLPTESSTTSKVSLPEKSVGDSGLNWLRRAYQRIKEQAMEENKSLEEIAAARWGSLEKLESLLKEAEAKANSNNSISDKRNSESWKTRNAYKSKHKGNEQNYSRHKKSWEGKSRNSSNAKNRNDDKLFQQPIDDSENSMQQRKFCWENKSEVVPSSKRNWMKKEAVRVNCAAPQKNEETNAETEAIKKKEVADELLEQPQILSDKEMNELGAKLIKAEMLGRKEQAEQLKMKLDAARKARENAATDKLDEKTVVLVRTNEKGYCQPLSSAQYQSSTASGKTEKREMKQQSRRKDSWLLDNNKYSLKQMFEREKMTTSEDKNIEFAKMLVKAGPDDGDMDGYICDNIKEKSAAEQEEYDKNRAVREHVRTSAILEKCQYCLESSHNKKHLIIAIGIKTYLALPSTQSFTNGHCLIVPMSHTSSGTLLDEDVWSEIKIFRKGLTKMFEEIGKVAIFMETSMYHRRHPHTVIECIPVPKEDGDMAPFYFKKAIMESETEWSNNKKLVDLYKKDLCHAVPQGLPYFSVEFGLDGGFAHVIEDEKLFPSYFGKEIIGGMLEMEAPNLWRKNSREDEEQQRKKLKEFRELWKSYDWTVRLKQS